MTTGARLSGQYRWVPTPLAGVCEPEPPGARPPRRLLDRSARPPARGTSRRTEKPYAAWVRRHILFHGKRHPTEMGAPEVTQF
jgi:Phage integrase, N-terminal SAM-like domain